MLRLRPLGLEEIPVPVFSPVVFLLFFSADFSPALQVYKLLQMQAMDYLQVEAVPSAPGAPVHHRRHSHTGVRGSRWGARVRPPPIGLLLGQSWHRWLNFFWFQDLTVIRTPKNWRGFFPSGFPQKATRLLSQVALHGKDMRQANSFRSRRCCGAGANMADIFFFRDHLLSDAPW